MAIRVAIIWESLGPYHVARARALQGVGELHPLFIELASRDRQHAWEVAREEISESHTALMEGPYREKSQKALSRSLETELSSFDPEAVVVAGYATGPMRAAARWARARGRASILMFVGTAWDRRRRWWKEWVKRKFILKYFDSGLVGGRSHRPYLATLGIPDEYIWEKGNVVDGKYFACKVAEARGCTDRSGPSEASFLFVGRLSPEKNLLRLLEAYREYRLARSGGWDLVMVGDGPQREDLQRRAQHMGLKGVRWLGYRQIDELPSCYAQSDALVLPSVSEPWGLVVNEAMACGLPVLVSDHCGCAVDLVEEGRNGYTFTPDDVGEMAERMLTLASLSESAREGMGSRSRQIIAAYTPEAWAESLADCVRQTIARRSREGSAVTT